MKTATSEPSNAWRWNSVNRMPPAEENQSSKEGSNFEIPVDMVIMSIGTEAEHADP